MERLLTLLIRLTRLYRYVDECIDPGVSQHRGDLFQLVQDVGRVGHSEAEHTPSRDGGHQSEEEVCQGDVVGPAFGDGRRGGAQLVEVVGPLEIAAVGPQIFGGEPELLHAI